MEDILLQVHIIRPSHVQDGQQVVEPDIFVLFRGGHYDLVYPDSTSWIELQSQSA
jgi:hypothetical protein